jgi:hypothetical protein
MRLQTRNMIGTREGRLGIHLQRRPRRMRSIRAAVLLALFLAGVSSRQLVLADEASAQPHVSVVFLDGRITVRALDAPLSQVLEEIGRQSGIVVRFNGDLNRQVNLTMVGTPVPEAIRRLTGETALVMIHGPSPALGGVPPVREIWAYTGSGDPGSARVVRVVRAEAPVPAPARPLSAEESEHVARLLAGRGDSGDRARLRALDRLSGRVDRVAIAALGRILVEGEDPAVRLGQVLFGDEDHEVRLLAVDHLARDPGEAAHAFLQAAADDPDQEVRATARQALGIG